jgi:hypothetical protein
MALIVGGTTVTGTQTLEASTLTGTASAINGSNITNLPAPSAANVGTATASISYNTVGSYAFCQMHLNPTDRNPGQTTAGSNLEAGQAAGGSTDVSIPSGTWSCRGVVSGGGNVEQRTTAWLRTS